MEYDRDVYIKRESRLLFNTAYLKRGKRRLDFDSRFNIEKTAENVQPCSASIDIIDG